MYYGKPPRLYILTRRESDAGIATCPKCKQVLELVPFKKSDKLYRCECGFHIEKSAVFDEFPKAETEAIADRILNGLDDKFFG